MKILKHISAALLLFFSIQTKAQEFPYHYFTHITPMVNNPALAAIDYKIQAGATSYNLWAAGFKPLTDNLVSFSIAPDFKKRKRRNSYSTRVGLGGTFLQERIGPFSQNILQLMYAYHIPLTKGTILSLGISGLMEYLKIDVNSLTPLDDNDPRLLTGTNSSLLIDGGFGASVHNNDFRLSFSIMNLTPGTFDFGDDTAMDIENYRKFFLAGNYRVGLNEKMNVSPSVTVRNSFENKIDFDVSAELDLKFIRFGAGYRTEKSIFVFAEIPVSDFTFSYTSENPLLSNHMIGNGHTISVYWNFNQLN